MVLSEKRLDINLNSYDVVDKNLVTSIDFIRNFGAPEDYIETHVYSANNKLINSNYNFKGYSIPPTLKGEEETTTNYLELFPGKYIEDLGYISGKYRVVYNILRKKIVNVSGKPFFIKTISPNRTELRISSNELSDAVIQSGTLNFIDEFQSSDYYKDFLINFGDNKLVNAVNIALDTNTTPFSILVKLYKPLPQEFSEKATLWFVEEMATPIVYEVQVTPSVTKNKVPFLKSANFNIEVDFKANSISDYYNKKTILSNDSLFSYQNLINKLNKKGISISIDYEDYNSFIHFSSATRRLINFINKVKSLESKNQDLQLIKSSPSYTNSTNTSQSAYLIQKEIIDIVTNFDGYENFLYYETSSKSWPKSGSSKPYALYPSTGSEAVTWIGSLNENSAYYGGQIYEASEYDNQNENNLVYTIPEYLRMDEQNEKFDQFVEMMGQYFDNIWIYIKSITDLYRAKNNLNEGISKDLVYFALRSLGVKLYNSKANDDLYRYLVGSSISGSYVNQSSPYDTLVSASAEIVPGQDVQKEILKRIYHNLPSLLKKKGTNDGIDDLITLYGIPYTVLSPTQFGGSDKSNQTVEYTYSRFSYSIYTTGSASISVPWNSLYSTATPIFKSYVPDTIEFRFKPQKNTYFVTSSILEVADTGSTKRSFGVDIRPDSQLGFPYSKLNFYLSGSAGVVSSSISLPIYNTGSTGEVDWWNVMLRRENHTSASQNSVTQSYTLVVANKIDTYIGHRASSSIFVHGALSSSYNYAWSNPNQTLYLGSSGLTTDTYFYPSNIFVGNYQELRYWAAPLSQSTFFSHVLNPESIQGNVSGSSYQDLVARFALGNDLSYYNHSLITTVQSIHPNYSYRVFYNTSVSQSASFSNFENKVNYISNIEEYIATSPNSVYSIPVNNKVKIVDNNITGSVLSNILRLEDESNVYFTKDLHFTDVSFSPQNEINKDIISNYGTTIDLDEYIGNPKESTLENYPRLVLLNEEYYKKYKSKYNYKDFVRLIQFYDNALFKMILDFVPARDNVSTGLTIKSPILERPKFKTPPASGDSEYNAYFSEISGSNLTADSIYSSGVGDGRDFYTGELSGSEIDIYAIFLEKNRNPYL
jgi:hypothetical protein